MASYRLMQPNGRLSTAIRSNADAVASMRMKRVPGVLLSRTPRGVSARPIVRYKNSVTANGEARWA